MKDNLLAVDPFALPGMPVESHRSFPDIQAIYFVIKGDEVLYIGKTMAGLAKRWRYHGVRNQVSGQGAVVRWIETDMPDNEQHQIERQLIKLFKPKLNSPKDHGGIGVSYPARGFRGTKICKSCQKQRLGHNNRSGVCAECQRGRRN